MKNEKSQQCPKGIDFLVVRVTVLSEAKGRKSRTRRLQSFFVPGDRVLLRDGDGIVLFDFSVNCFGKVSTVVPLDK